MQIATTPPNTMRSITPDEARRALYLDIEKLIDQPPSLVGVLCEGDMRHVSVDERLHAAARATGIPCMTLEELAHDLVARCEREERVIVAYSQSELDWFLEHAGVDLTPWYRNARMIGKRWINREHRGALSEWTLAAFAEFLGSNRPHRLRPGKATMWLRAAFRASEVGYNGMRRSQRQRWRWVRDYNKWDCQETMDLCLAASAALPAPDPTASECALSCPARRLA